MEKIKWLVDHWDTIAMAAGTICTIGAIIIKWVLPTEKAEKWFVEGGKIKKVMASVYFVLEKIVTHSR